MSAAYPLDAQIHEVERTIAYREKAYAALVANNALSQAASDRQIGTMRAVLATLRERCVLEAALGSASVSQGPREPDSYEKPGFS